jgi:RHS repeat-associated protein
VTVTTHPTDGGQRHTITNAYNSDGTLASKTDELGHVTSYTYNDYRRVRSVTPPVRGLGDNGTYTTHFYYDANGTGDDYRFTDSNVTYVTLPSGKRTQTVYDDNRRKSSVTVAYGTSDAATTTYGYDNVGNLTTVKAPNQQPGQQYAGESTVTVYDERNRPSSITDALNHTTSLTYDLAGRKKSITRPNNQTITYNSYDAMNRVLQQTATETPEPDAVTKYTYTQAGLLATMQDPRLVAQISSETYTYAYDTTGRKTSVTYPRPQPSATPSQEQWSYDTAGRLATFTNRNNYTQTFTYDALNRVTSFTWNDGGLTPSVSFGYDVASHLTSVNNANANISRTYYNDNLLRAETETITGGSAKTVTYTYDGDGNRASTQYPSPDNYLFNYTYTGRNQFAGVTNFATYVYDVNGNLITRSPANSTSSSYSYDALDRVTHISHSLLVHDTRTLDYDYDNVGNRKWTKREGNVGDVFGYDYADQVDAVQLNTPNPDTTPPPAQNIAYDANGNRNWFGPYGVLEQYAINNLSQYSSRTIYTGGNSTTTTAVYDYSGNLTLGLDQPTQSGYTYDAQNRLTQASKSGTTDTFKYDGLNRQVSRSVTGQPTTYSVWDGWNLIEEYQSGGATAAAYVYGAGGLLTDLSLHYYYQDGSDSTSHLADSSGNLLEWYRYDLQGTPVFYNASNTQISASNYGVRYLFTGQRWHSELGLYDLRNRFYSPDIGRFLQPDPIGFKGDPTNLYRYCTNNPVKWSDARGLLSGAESGFTYTDYQNIGLDSQSAWLASHFVPTPEELLLAGAAFSLVLPVTWSYDIWGVAVWETLIVTGDAFILPEVWTHMPAHEIPPSGTQPLYEGLPAPGGEASRGTEIDTIQASALGGQPVAGVAPNTPASIEWGPDGYGFVDPTGRQWVVGYSVPSGLNFIGDNFDFYSPSYNDSSNQGVSAEGTAILNSLNFGMALNSVFQALGGGGGGSGIQIPRQL